ncbi:MAG: caspase family protein [Bradymonadaceae bacterium]|nr:caspase family protein [Lujinxingiaceae bacterium]
MNKVCRALIAPLTVLAISLLAMSGCKTTSVPQNEGIELLVQQGHAHSPYHVNTWSDEHYLHVMTLTAGDARAWRAPIDDPLDWSVRRIWQGRKVTWTLGIDPREYVVMNTAHVAELYRFGDWANPLLTRADGLRENIKWVGYIAPSDTNQAWRAMAVQEDGDADGIGYRDSYRIFFSPDGESWALLELPDTPTNLLDFKDLYDGRFAVLLPPTETTPAAWRLFELGADLSWKPCANFAGLYNSFRIVDWSPTIVIEPAATPGQPQPTAQWWYRDVAGEWTDIASLLPGVPEISDIEAQATNRLWKVTGPDGPLDVHFYLHDADRGWQLVADILPDPPATIRDVISIAGTKGIAVQAGLFDLPAQNQSNWRYYLFDEADRLMPLHAVLPNVPPRIWTVRTEGEDRLLGVQELGSEGEAENGYGTRWFVHDQKRWVPLEDRLPIPASEIADLRASSAEVLKIKRKVQDTDPVEQWWIDLGQGYVLLREALGDDVRVPRYIRQVDYWPGATIAHGLIGIGVDDDQRFWYMQDTNKRWHPLQDTLVAGRAAAPAVHRAHVFAVLWSVTPGGDRWFSVTQRRGSEAAPGPGAAAYLVRGAGDAWQSASFALPQLPAGSVRLSEAGDVLTAHVDGHAPQRYRRLANGQWVSVDEGVSGESDTLRDAYTFLGDRGLALRRQPADQSLSVWHYFYRDESRGWVALDEVLPQTYPRIASVYSLPGDQVIGLQEEDDSNDDGIRNQWAYLVRDPTGAWTPLAQALPSVGPLIYRLASFLQGQGLAVQEERRLDERQVDHLWHYYMRDTGGAWRPLDTLLPGLSEQGEAIDKVHDFFGTNGLAVRLGPTGGWRLFRRPAPQAAWAPITLPTPTPGLLDVRGDLHGRVLAIRTLGDDGEGVWNLWLRGDKNTWQPAITRFPKIPDTVQDLRIALDEGLLGVQARKSAGSGLWQWFALDEDGLSKHLGHTSSPSWPGFSYTQASNNQVVIEDAVHVTDGVSSRTAPLPKVWFHRGTQATTGQAYRAPDAFPDSFDVYAPGASGLLLVYEVEGRRRATSFSRGSVEVSTHEIAKGGNLVEEIRFIHNTLPDGTIRVHRYDDPTRFIMLHTDSSGAEIYYDDRGYFYDARPGHSLDTLSFRRGSDIYTFRQLAAYLFRPDRLEERLGLVPGSFFTLTESDQSRISEARELAGPGELALATLRPPQLEIIGRVKMSVTSPRVDIRVSATGQGLSDESFAAHVLGAGQARSASPAPQRQRGMDSLNTLSKTLSIALLEGDNHIEISVVDAAGLTHTRSAHVRYEPAQPAARTLWLGIVAAGDYDDTRLKPLEFTASDAQTILAAFSAQEGKLFDEVKVRQWCDADACDARAHHGVLRREVPAFFSQMNQGDYATLFVSGHGTKRGHTYHFVPTDGDLDHDNTMISWLLLESWITAAPVLGKRLLILDSCHSGALGRDGREKERIVEQAYRHRGLYILSASAADAYAYELGKIGNGLLTHALKHGLVGGADISPADGRVSFQELSDFVARRVRKLARDNRIVQEPYTPIVDAAMDFSLAHVTRARYTVSLVVIEVNAQNVVDYNSPQALAHWESLLTKNISGLRIDKESPALLIELHLSEGAVRLVIKSPDNTRHFDKPLNREDPGDEALGKQVEEALANAQVNL